MITTEALEMLAASQATSAANDSIDTALVNPAAAVALPNNFAVHDLERYLQKRRRARGTMQTSDIASFARYTVAHHDVGATVFVSDDIKATAVLNLGTVDHPGHADDTAVLTGLKTAAFTALLAIDGQPRSQRDTAEFIEDWAEHIECLNSAPIPLGQALAAIRKLTIDAARKSTTSSSNLAESRSAFESVEVSSEDPVPELVYFTCAPYHGLSGQVFQLRLSVLTAGDKPMLVLRIKQLQQHVEEMREELQELVRAALKDAPELTVVSGTYKAA